VTQARGRRQRFEAYAAAGPRFGACTAESRELAPQRFYGYWEVGPD
jgi:hypothetical protein